MRGPHVEKRRWKVDGKARESAFYYLVFYVRTPRGARRVYRRTYPPTDQKRLAEEQLYKAMTADVSAMPGNTTVRHILDAYETYLKAEHKTTWNARRYWIEAWRVAYGHLRAASFKLAHVSQFVAKRREEGHADGTIGDQLGTLRAAFNRAVAEETIDPHPACAIKLGRFRSPERHVTWTDDDFRKLTEELPRWAARLFALLLATGLRVGDGLSLRWENVRKDRIIVRQGKTGNDVHVPLTAASRAVLAQIPRQERDGKPSPYLFPGQGRKGEPYIMRSLQRALAIARVASGVTGKTIHDLRRTYATRLLNNRVPPNLIAALLGQRDTRLVGRYTHAEFETLRDAARLGSPQRAAVPAAVPRLRPAKRSDIRR